MKNEVVEVFEPETALEMTRKDENSQSSQTSLNQRCSTLESVIERYEEEMKKYWEEQHISSMKVLLNQMLSAKEEVEKQESEEDNQGNSHTSKAEKYIEGELMEPAIQKAFDEDNSPIITQKPCLDIREVKETSKSTEKRIVTKIPRTTFKKRSTANNPTPKPSASKLNQAINKRKLVEERPKQGTIAESSPPLRSFLLTNWKKSKKVENSMSS
ncbi:uncharacterized protein DS421_3g86370 [Arachis hypogaea]|nr:uncharacterized protein DS421_3g86370 [Arachis hypogaea]